MLISLSIGGIGVLLTLFKPEIVSEVELKVDICCAFQHTEQPQNEKQVSMGSERILNDVEKRVE